METKATTLMTGEAETLQEYRARRSREYLARNYRKVRAEFWEGKQDDELVNLHDSRDNPCYSGCALPGMERLCSAYCGNRRSDLGNNICPEKSTGTQSDTAKR